MVKTINKLIAQLFSLIYLFIQYYAYKLSFYLLQRI